MDWRILAGITVISWGVYNVILKGVSSRISWQMSMMWFVAGYGLMIAIFLSINSVGQKFKWIETVSLLPLACGILCGLGAITFFKAIPQIQGSVLMPLVGLYVLVSAVGCLICFHEPVTFRIVLGISFATIAIILLGK